MWTRDLGGGQRLCGSKPGGNDEVETSCTVEEADVRDERPEEANGGQRGPAAAHWAHWAGPAIWGC